MNNTIYSSQVNTDLMKNNINPSLDSPSPMTSIYDYTNNLLTTPSFFIILVIIVVLYNYTFLFLCFFENARFENVFEQKPCNFPTIQTILRKYIRKL